jgi:hypothetical protein
VPVRVTCGTTPRKRSDLEIRTKSDGVRREAGLMD